MVRLNSIQIFSKVGNLGQGVYIKLVWRGWFVALLNLKVPCLLHNWRDEYCRRSPVKFQRNLSRRYATKKLIFPIGNITQLHHHPRWQVGGWGIFQAKEKATPFRGRLIYLSTLISDYIIHKTH